MQEKRRERGNMSTTFFFLSDDAHSPGVRTRRPIIDYSFSSGSGLPRKPWSAARGVSRAGLWRRPPRLPPAAVAEEWQGGGRCPPQAVIDIIIHNKQSSEKRSRIGPSPPENRARRGAKTRQRSFASLFFARAAEVVSPRVVTNHGSVSTCSCQPRGARH